MIVHLCRLAWNRRRTNLLLVAELFLSFLVLTPLVAGWVLFAAEELKPLGFEYQGVWYSQLMGRDLFGEKRGMSRERAWEEHRRSVELVEQELGRLDQVEVVALASNAPLRFSNSWNGISSVYISDEGLEVLGPRLLTGRWFRPEDEALDWIPAVIDQELGRELFGEEDPLGKSIGDSPVIDVNPIDGFQPPDPTVVRVVGVIEDCFYFMSYGGDDGFVSVKTPGFIFLRLSDEWLANPTQNWIYFLVKPYADAGPEFGEKLKSRIKAVVPPEQSMRLNAGSLEGLRELNRQNRLWLLTIIAVISGLMMLMVALGLTGMMWQNVRRRTREIGIRRAVGAPGGRIYGQFLGELVVLVTAAIALGCLPLFQFGLLDLVLWSRVPAWVAACGVGATAVVLVFVVMLCGLYPSWLAARVRPAEALHHD